VDVAIESFVGSAATIYVNNVGGRHIYVYRRDELMAAIKKAIPQGLLRGVGRANDDTFGVKIPLAGRRWSRGDDFVWKWQGVGVEADAIESLQELLVLRPRTDWPDQALGSVGSAQLKRCTEQPLV